MNLFLIAATPGPRFELPPAWGMALGLLLVALNGFFVAAEFALVKVRPTQIEPYVQAGERGGHGGRPHVATPRARPPRPLPLGHPARHPPGEPRAGLGRRAGLRLDRGASGAPLRREQ